MNQAIKPRIGYEALASHLLDHGISADRIIKHRWPLMMAARFADELPTDVDERLREFTVTFSSGNWRLVFACDNLSTRCRMRVAQDGIAEVSAGHPTEAKIEYLFAWLASANDAEKAENERKPKRKRKAAKNA